MTNPTNIRKYIIVWTIFFVLDILIIGRLFWVPVHRVNEHPVTVIGHLSAGPQGGMRRRAFYTYTYNGQSYAGRGRSFPPNEPAQYMTPGQAVTVTLNSENPAQSVLGDSRVAQRAATRVLLGSSIFISLLAVLICYLINRRRPNPPDYGTYSHPPTLQTG